MGACSRRTLSICVEKLLLQLRRVISAAYLAMKGIVSKGIGFQIQGTYPAYQHRPYQRMRRREILPTNTTCTSGSLLSPGDIQDGQAIACDGNIAYAHMCVDTKAILWTLPYGIACMALGIPTASISTRMLFEDRCSGGDDSPSFKTSDGGPYSE